MPAMRALDKRATRGKVSVSKQQRRGHTGHLLPTPHPFTHQKWTQCRSMEPINYPWCNKPNTYQQVSQRNNACDYRRRNETLLLDCVCEIVLIKRAGFKARQRSLHCTGGPDYATCAHTHTHVIKSNTATLALAQDHTQGKLQIKCAVTRW